MGDACGPKVVVVGFLGGLSCQKHSRLVPRASCVGEQAGAVGRSQERYGSRGPGIDAARLNEASSSEG